VVLHRLDAPDEKAWLEDVLRRIEIPRTFPLGDLHPLWGKVEGVAPKDDEIKQQAAADAHELRLADIGPERALALLGDAKLAAGDKEGAAAVYDKLTQTYPQAKALANLGRARLAVDGSKFSEAEPLLQPLLDASAKTGLPAASDGPAYTQAHYLAGRIKESAGDHQAALEHYLTASAVFPFDKASASSAQQRADALRAEHAGLIAP
jgi:tetratricopeptide (TPR) repeat protein